MDQGVEDRLQKEAKGRKTHWGFCNVCARDKKSESLNRAGLMDTERKVQVRNIPKDNP